MRTYLAFETIVSESFCELTLQGIRLLPHASLSPMAGKLREPRLSWPSPRPGEACGDPQTRYNLAHPR